MTTAKTPTIEGLDEAINAFLQSANSKTKLIDIKLLNTSSALVIYSDKTPHFDFPETPHKEYKIIKKYE